MSSAQDWTSLLRTAESVLDAARPLAMQRPAATHAKGERDFATDVDLAVQQRIGDLLRAATPDIPLVSEEANTELGHSAANWVLDPIDGTINLSHGTPLVAIALSLLWHGEPVVAVVDLPLLGERYRAVAGGAAELGGEPITVAPTAELGAALVAVNDFPFRSEQATAAQLRLVESLVPKVQRVRLLGSSVISLCWVAAGKLDAAVLSTNKVWDTSAGALLARQAGAWVGDFAGRPHSHRSDSILAAGPAIAADLVKHIGAANGNDRDG